MKRTARSRHHHNTLPSSGAVVTIKRRRYRKKNKTQHCNKRKNATTRKNYKDGGGPIDWARKWNDERQTRNRIRQQQQQQGESLIASGSDRSERYGQQSQPQQRRWFDRIFRRTPPVSVSIRNLPNIASAKQGHLPLQQIAPSSPPRNDLTTYMKNPVTSEYDVPETSPPVDVRVNLKPFRAPDNSMNKRGRNSVLQRISSSAISQPPPQTKLSKDFMRPDYAEALKSGQKLANPESSSPHLSASSSPPISTSPPHTMFNTLRLVKTQEYPSSNDPWTTYKYETLMPIWKSQLDMMKKIAGENNSKIDEFLQFAAQQNDPLGSDKGFLSYEAAIWEVVCDTVNLQNALMHSISKFTSADAISTCLVFQEFLFPFKTDGVSELITKRGFRDLKGGAGVGPDIVDAVKTNMIISNETTIKNFALMLLRSIMIQMSRAQYKSTYELNSKRELLLRLVSCAVLVKNTVCTVLATLREAINVLFEVEDYRSTHYEEYKVFMGEAVHCPHNENNPILAQCREIAARYSPKTRPSPEKANLVESDLLGLDEPVAHVELQQHEKEEESGAAAFQSPVGADANQNQNALADRLLVDSVQQPRSILSPPSLSASSPNRFPVPELNQSQDDDGFGPPDPRFQGPAQPQSLTSSRAPGIDIISQVEAEEQQHRSNMAEAEKQTALRNRQLDDNVGSWIKIPNVDNVRHRFAAGGKRTRNIKKNKKKNGRPIRRTIGVR